MKLKPITLEEYGIISNNGIQLDCIDYNGWNAYIHQENLYFCYERWGYVEVYTIHVFEFLHKKNSEKIELAKMIIESYLLQPDKYTVTYLIDAINHASTFM